MNKLPVRLFRFIYRQPWSRGKFHTSAAAGKYNQPLSGYEMPRSGGIATTFRLPLQTDQPEGLDVCFVGIPMDSGASNRSGTRLGQHCVCTDVSVPHTP